MLNYIAVVTYYIVIKKKNNNIKVKEALIIEPANWQQNDTKIILIQNHGMVLFLFFHMTI